MSNRVLALALAAALAVGLAVRLASWTGMIASDDLTHAWAAVHFWDDPIEHGMPDGPDSAYTVNARRAGVNVPLAIGAAIAGPSEATFGTVTLLESLLGVLACAAWAGALVGRRGAVLAAWLAAVTPVDVWQATIWLQDDLYAAGLAAAMAALAWGVRTEKLRWWAVAGAIFGYLQYVKESASIVVAVLVIAGVVRSIRARRVDRPTVALLGGVAVMQIVACTYWAIAVGDPLYYVREWLGRQAAVEAEDPMRPFPHNLVRLGLYLGYHQALGLGLLVAAGFGVRWLRRGDAPARIRHDAALVAIVQLALLLHVLRWGAWTQRYLLQIVPVAIALGAAGLATVRVRWQVAAVAATALGLVLGHPQHGRHRADVVRAAYRALPSLAPADVPVVVALGSRPAHYADRALALLDGYRSDRFRAGDPAAVTRGLVVYSHLERHPTRPTAPPGRRVFTAETRGGREWIEIYAVGLP